MADRQRSDTFADPSDPNRSRINLLNWDGNGRPERAVPDRKEDVAMNRAVLAKAASLLLRYPDASVLSVLPQIRAALPPSSPLSIVEHTSPPATRRRSRSSTSTHSTCAGARACT
jgi:hypothetical protein